MTVYSNEKSELETTAQRLAALTREEADLLIDGYVDKAIREWRVGDATFWQRAKIRAGMIRASAQRQFVPRTNIHQPETGSW